MFTQAEWRGRPFRLMNWQKRIVRKLFGWMRPDGTRRYRMVFIAVPRKNGKTEFAAALGLFLMLADGEPAAPVYSIAGNEEQARIVFDAATNMTAMSPALFGIVERLKPSLFCGATNASFKPLTGKAKSKHGFNPHGVIGDEVHVWTDREQYEVMHTAVGARRQPVEIYITTAGNRRESVCWELWQTALKVRDGVLKLDHVLPVIYAADPDDDWEDPATWRKANPSYGVSVKPASLEAACEEAKASPASENEFRQLRLNQWTENHARWIPTWRWDLCKAPPLLDRSADRPFELEDFRGCEAIGGLDLAKVNDLSALALLFPPPNPVSETAIAALVKYWCPEDDIRDRAKRDNVPYDIWSKTGLLCATPGNATDFEQIRQDINALVPDIALKTIGFDRHFAMELVQNLMADGFDMAGVAQTCVGLAGATHEMERRIIATTREGAAPQILHAGDAVTRWCLSNVLIFKDSSGNPKPDKARSSEKIDGVSALVNALTLMIEGERKDNKKKVVTLSDAFYGRG